MRRVILALSLAVLAAPGCDGGAPAKVKGRLVTNGEPMTVSGQVAVTFTALGGAGTSSAKSFTAVVNPNGSFELVASGGELPPGLYQVSVVAVGKAAAPFRGLVGDKSPVKRELKPGANDLTIDVAKPEG